MTAVLQEPVVSKRGLLALGALVLFSLAIVTTSRLTGVGTVPFTLPAAVESRDLRFADAENGAVLVFDASSDQLVERLGPGNGGFIRVVMRSLARQRRMAEIGAEPPFRLTRYASGQLTLTDSVTNRQIDLGAFGSDNIAAFARLMHPGSTK
jgi:putative photosynthetic complex assembly protein